MANPAGAREGGGFLTNPDALNNDGVLNLVMIPSILRLQLLLLLPITMAGKHGMFSFVEFAQFKSMIFESDQAIPIHLDGEVWANYDQNCRRIEMTIEPDAIQVIQSD